MQKRIDKKLCTIMPGFENPLNMSKLDNNT